MRAPRTTKEDAVSRPSVACDERPPFSTSTLRRLRRRLLTERVEQLERAVSLEDAAAPGTAMAVEWDLDAVRGVQVRQTLRQIEAALGRMEAGTYGRCEGCGARLPLARLEALPYARWCVTCAQAAAPSRARLVLS
jgi:DnaK suppressor protein